VYEGDGKCEVQKKVSFGFYSRPKPANAPYVNSIERVDVSERIVSNTLNGKESVWESHKIRYTGKSEFGLVQ
jgi:hypothetical protein